MKTKDNRVVTPGKQEGKKNSEQGEIPYRMLVGIVCRGYCNYFRGTGGEAECGGYTAVSRAVALWMITAHQMEKVRCRRPLPPERLKILSEKLCKSCGYKENACDFQSSSPPDGATPCGGYRVFQVLLDGEEIGKEDLDKVLSGPTSNRKIKSNL